MDQTEIFLSYAWKGESEALVDQLCAAFAVRGYIITRDKSSMNYKDSIKAFMERIGRGKFIIAVVSDKYMKSEYCLYEANRLLQSPEVKERLFPIVLRDADIFSFQGQAAYLKYWTKTYQEMEASYKEVADSSPTMVAPLTERLRDVETATRFINDFMATVGDMNVLTSQKHLESNFKELIAAIEKRMQALDQTAPEKTLATSPQAQPKEVPMLAIPDLVNSAWGLLQPYLPALATAAAGELGKKVPEAAGKAWELVKTKFAAKESAQEALADLQSDPKNEAFQTVFKVQMQKMLNQDQSFAGELLKLLETAGSDYKGQVIGGGAIAQGAGAKAVGQGGILVEGNLTGNITIGNNNKINDK